MKERFKQNKNSIIVFPEMRTIWLQNTVNLSLYIEIKGCKSRGYSVSGVLKQKIQGTALTCVIRSVVFTSHPSCDSLIVSVRVWQSPDVLRVTVQIQLRFPPPASVCLFVMETLKSCGNC